MFGLVIIANSVIGMVQRSVPSRRWIKLAIDRRNRCAGNPNAHAVDQRGGADDTSWDQVVVDGEVVVRRKT